MLIPKKEDQQGAGLSDTKCTSRTIMVNEWTLVTPPVQSRVSSRRSHKLPKARAHEKISPPLWRSALWATSSYGWGLLAPSWLKIWGNRGTAKPLPHLYYWQIQLPTSSESFEILDLGTGRAGEGVTARHPFSDYIDQEIEHPRQAHLVQSHLLVWERGVYVCERETHRARAHAGLVHKGEWK